MATLTSNISNVSLTVSGTTTKTATISWTLPSVPAGGTINSCTLTGTATASMTKGSATIKVNGTTVSSGSNFSINLGTANTTSSVSATAVGGNKNANGTVTFSNLVYTVDYTEPAVTYTVTFVDWDGTILKTQTVNSGNSATAPMNPTRDGYRFTGWDKTFTNVTSNLTVTAQYVIVYTVTFLDYDGTILKTEEVLEGESATAPEVNRVGYALIGWSVDFTNVTSNITTIAQYVVIQDILKIKENGNWINIGKVYKRISGNWVEQENSNWNTLFDTNIKYIKRIIHIPTAILYEDGTLIFSSNDNIDKSHGYVMNTYTGWDNSTNIPWLNEKENIIHVYFDNVSATTTDRWFFNASNLVEVSGTLSNVTNMNFMFCGCSSLTSLDLSGFNTNNVTEMHSTFYNCSNLTSLNLSNFDTSNVTNMYRMFYGCSSLTSLDLSNFDTNNVTDMAYMFSNCSNLTSLDLSNFNTSNVTNIAYMFRSCSSLTTIYVKDESTKTKIESSTGFPSTATVIIGKPN